MLDGMAEQGTGHPRRCPLNRRGLGTEGGDLLTRWALFCGAGGLIGGHLVKSLMRDGFWVYAVRSWNVTNTRRPNVMILWSATSGTGASAHHDQFAELDAHNSESRHGRRFAGPPNPCYLPFSSILVSQGSRLRA
jgi:hypothetical protein